MDAERELRAAKIRFEGAFAQAPTGMAIVSFDEETFGELLEVNDALCALLQRSAHEIVGRRFADFTHPESASADVALARRVAAGELPRYETEKRFVRADGEIVIAFTTASLIHGEAGDRPYGIAHVHDVTARRRAEEEVEESERRFRAAFALALDGMLITNDDRCFMAGNRALATLFGIDVDDIPGRTMDEFMTLSPDETEQMWHDFQAAGEMVGELEIRRPDGELRQVEFSARANFTDGRHLSILRDVTDRRRSEEARERARRDSERLEAVMHQAQKLETVGQLAGGVAHDFNNILAVILNSCEFALAELDGHVAADDVRAVHAAAQRAAALTRQLLVFSRREIAEPKVLSLNGLIGDVERLLRRTISESIEVEVVLDAEAPEVEADPSHLEQVVLNLVVNARDAMPDGGRLEIKTSIVDVDEEYVPCHPGAGLGRHAMLAITDTGQGMHPEVLARAFDPFFTTKPKGAGTGLGLATTYWIVKENGGHLSLHSEPGAGTVALVFLPLAERPADAVSSESPEPLRPPGGERVLVVEDEDEVRRIAQRILVGAGYRVVCASRPEVAYELALGEVFDLVLTDVVMPGMSGPELVARVREVRAGQRALFTTGYTDRPEALPRGAVSLSKPFSRSTLLEHVARVLDE